jgi:sigma-54 dependent transcriptional regulator
MTSKESSFGLGFRNHICTVTAAVTEAGIFEERRAPLVRGAVRTRGITTRCRGGGGNRIEVDLAGVRITISSTKDPQSGLFRIRATASFDGRDVAVELRNRNGLLSDSEILAIRDAIYRFLIGWLPAEKRVFIETRLDGRPPKLSDADRIRMTEMLWENYTLNRIQGMSTSIGPGSEFHIVSHPESSIRKILDKARSLAVARAISGHPTSIHIYGPSGAGKELLARYIHEQSGAKGKFVAINCAAVAESLFDAMLFGVEPGAYTDAKERVDGAFVRAKNGTVFLDEIRSLSQACQGKLLRVLQDHEVTPLGGKESIPVNVRVISACNQDLLKSAEDDEFRMDLYWRLAPCRFDLDGLEDRLTDIPALLNYYAICAGSSRIQLKENLFKALFWHRWHGNVREFEHLYSTLQALHPGEIVGLDDELTGIEKGTLNGLRQGWKNYQAAKSLAPSAADHQLAKDLAARTDDFLKEARKILVEAVAKKWTNEVQREKVAQVSDKHREAFKLHLEASGGLTLAGLPAAPSCHDSLEAFRKQSRPNESQSSCQEWIRTLLKSVYTGLSEPRSTGDEESRFGSRYYLLELFLGKGETIRKSKPDPLC